MSEKRIDIDAEREILGAVLVRPAELPQLREVLAAEDFYHPAHARVFEALCAVADRRTPIDVTTVADQLRAKGVLGAIGGVQYLGEMTDGFATWATVWSHARIIADHARARRIGAAGRSIVSWASNETVGVEDLAHRASQELSEAAASKTLRQSATSAEVAFELSERLDALLRGEPPRAVWTGLDELDFMLGGFRAGQFVVLGARPAQGKTALAAQVSARAALDGNSVLFFSLEMPKVELFERLACGRAGINSEEIRTAITREQHAAMQETIADLSRLPIRWQDEGRTTWTQITQRARALAMREPIDLIVVDYLQKVRAPDGFKDGRERVVAEAATELKNLAKELRVPVLALAQINRGPTDREDTRPRVSDLRESGAIEAEADVILLLWRDPQNPANAELLVAKNRHGREGVVHMRFIPHETRFEGMETAANDNRRAS